MTREILINRVEIQLYHKTIDSHFDIWKVTSDLQGKQSYGKVVNTIYKSLNPLSLCSLGKGAYIVLTRKNSHHRLLDPHFTEKKILPGDLSNFNCAKLLLGALPYLTSEHNHSSEGVGLFYLADIEVIRNIEVLRTFQIKLELERQENIVIKIQAATFTPVNYHTNAEGELYGDCSHLPRIKFNRWAQELTRSKNGEFIKKKHRDRNMRSEVVSLDTKNPSKFWRSKMGILAMFMNDAERYLSNFISIKFQPIGPKYRAHFKESDIKKSYELINNLLTNKKLNLINLTNSEVSPLLNAMKDDGLDAFQSNEIQSDALNLVVHYDSEFYEASRLVDPYEKLRATKEAIVQSVYPGTILKDGKLSRTEYEACKKELFIKWEVSDQCLKLTNLHGNWMFAICKAQKDKEILFHTLTCKQGCLEFKLLSLGEAQETFLLDAPRMLKDGEHVVINLDTQDTYLFEDTHYVALPQFEELAKVMKELANGYAMGIQRAWIEEFLTLLDSEKMVVANRSLVADKLNALLAHNPYSKIMYKEDIFKDSEKQIAYKGSMQVFFDWVAAEKGLRLGASLKAQDSGYIEASLGLFYNEEERLYFVGDKDNVKSIPKFCRIRRILTDAATVPVELLKMMEVFHVRHKQATIYPFPFKHLREFYQR